MPFITLANSPPANPTTAFPGDARNTSSQYLHSKLGPPGQRRQSGAKRIKINGFQIPCRRLRILVPRRSIDPCLTRSSDAKGSSIERLIDLSS